MTPRLAALFVAVCIALSACGSASGEGGITVADGTSLRSFDPADREQARPATGDSLRPGPPITGALVADKVAVVHFWGSWCGPCRREQPIFERVWRQLRARGVQFLGVNTRRDQRAAALAFWDEFGVTYPSIYDPSSRIAFAWRVRVMPQTVVVDRRGRVAARIYGAVDDEAAFVRLLERELGS